MSGHDDAAAMEAAELYALRRRADERREELHGTLEQLTAKLAEDADVRQWARRAALGLGRATASAVRRSLPGPAAAPQAAGSPGGPRPTGGSRVIAIALPAALALAGGLWWLTHGRLRPSARKR